MSHWKSNSKILFGVSGGIAAYKTPDIIHGLVKCGCEVETILTKSAEEFVSPLVLSTLSGRRVWRDEDFLSAEMGWKIPHISLTAWASVFVVAPATANALRICADADASSLLGAAMLACKAPLVLFPAMNPNMLSNPAVCCAVEKLRKRGHTVVDPDSGLLACGYEGKGRLPANNVIYEHIWKAICPKKDMSGMKVLVTAGPTHEYIDPVRFISNPSSGKMGYAIAKAAWYRGASVTLVTGPCSLMPPVGVNVINVVSAKQMYDACVENAEGADIIIKAAAVGDFKAKTEEPHKIKRGCKDTLTLNLVPNKDIAAELGKIKKDGQILVGFAAETQDVIENAHKKLLSKNLDFIAVNDVLAHDAGFAKDTNTLTVIPKNGEMTKFSGSKDEAAEFLLDAVLYVK